MHVTGTFYGLLQKRLQCINEANRLNNAGAITGV